jgi:Right handed beta helix region
MLKARITGGLIAITLMVCGPVQAAPTCQNLEPSNNPEQNSKRIAACLASPEASAKLSNGVFLISHIIKMPQGSTLAGSGGTVIRPADVNVEYKDNSVITLTDGNVVKDIALIAGGRLKQTCCTAVVSFIGSGSRLENTDVSDQDVAYVADQADEVRIIGIYFIGTPDSHDNVATHVKIHDLNFGVIFRKGLTLEANNRIEDSEIFNLSCDAISFSGGGVIQGSYLHDNGFDCKQKPTPIPGGGIYAKGNAEGVKIINNTITDICGHGLDIVASDNVTISGNKVVQKGAPMHGRHPVCVGSSAATLVDDSHMKVTNNVFSVTDTPPLGPFLHLFPDYAKGSVAIYAPLRDKEGEIFAVRLLQSKGKVSGNRFIDNKMSAECSLGGPCAGHGIALFISPGAGEAGPNGFIHNTLAGTELPALRCGHDHWEGNSFCARTKADGACQSGASSLAQDNDACSAK